MFYIENEINQIKRGLAQILAKLGEIDRRQVRIESRLYKVMVEMKIDPEQVYDHRQPPEKNQSPALTRDVFKETYGRR